MTRTYLDHNATSLLKPSVRAAMEEVWALPVNPSSVHQEGRRAHKLLEDARANIAEKLAVFPREIIFTASATEANNWALSAFSQRRVLTSAIEHRSVIHAAERIIPVDSNGIVNLAALETLLKDGKPALVSVMLANNETGVIQPLAEIAVLCSSHGALLHTDAVQAVGRVPLDIGLLGADLVTISSHKCGGPVGAAALVVRGKLEIPPKLYGGGQELRRRAGTENLAAIIGMAAAMADPIPDLAPLRDALEAALPDAVIYGKDAPRLPNTSCIGMPNVPAETQLMHFDLSGIAVSAGSACTSGRIATSHVLDAMAIPAAEAGCAIRVSFGWDNTEADCKRFVEAWQTLYKRFTALNN